MTDPASRRAASGGDGVVRFAQIPEDAGHHREALTHHWQQYMLVRGMLRAGCIRMRHPHRGQAQRIGEYVVGQRAAEIGQQRRFRAEGALDGLERSEEHTSELQSLMRISYAVFCLKKKNTRATIDTS